jgi:hypothetical protein
LEDVTLIHIVQDRDWWEDNIKMDFMGTGECGVDSSGSGCFVMYIMSIVQ